MSESNRRVFPRAEGEYAAWYQLPGGSYEQCLALDIGIDGACLLVDRELPGQTSFEVDFQLASDWLVRARAEVLWQRTEGAQVLVGIRYRAKRSADRSLMGPWVHRQRKNQAQ